MLVSFFLFGAALKIGYSFNLELYEIVLTFFAALYGFIKLKKFKAEHTKNKFLKIIGTQNLTKSIRYLILGLMIGNALYLITIIAGVATLSALFK
ncbi:MAG: hypothetical protein WC843_03825 [Candidatus Gracilibacteria bacterium]